MKAKYVVSYTEHNGRLFVDAWDIYNQLVSILSPESAREIHNCFRRAEKKAEKLSGK